MCSVAYLKVEGDGQDKTRDTAYREAKEKQQLPARGLHYEYLINKIHFHHSTRFSHSSAFIREMPTRSDCLEQNEQRDKLCSKKVRRKV